ncbi:MAG: peptidyl-prolyl cis-trans isomerase [Verrucomicrobiales bacterium]|nr:peptidyl-prolyl cis-trans isomerase [Verrucomicrobiales bacterium]
MAIPVPQPQTRPLPSEERNSGHSRRHAASRVAALAFALAVVGAILFLRDHHRHSTPQRTPKSAALDEVARVGDASITASEFRVAWKKRHPDGSASVAPNPSAVLEPLIQRELLFAEAERAGFTRRDDLLASWRAFVATRFHEERQALAPPAEPVTESEIAAHYQTHSDAYAAPERRRLALLQLPTQPEAPALPLQESRKDARSIHDEAVTEARNSRDFGPLAARHSIHQASRHFGGDIGWVTRAQAARAWPEEVAEAAFALAEPGDLSPLLATSEGVYLLKLVDREPARPAPLAAVRERIRYELTRARASQAETQFLDELRLRHPVQVFGENLAAAVPRETSVAHQPPALPAR